MTEQEKITNFETQSHIQNVCDFMVRIVRQLLGRAVRHDQSKLMPPELPVFVEYTPKLQTSTYGSKEYKEFLKGMKPALDHHYAENRHHPEHFENGVDGMNLVDLMEMLCDWKAATMRHEDGDILRSIELNKKRFKLSPQLVSILKNTAELFDGRTPE